MYCLVKSSQCRSGQILWSLIGRGIQPRTFTPILNNVIWFGNGCDPCSGKSASKRCSPQKRRDPCGPSKGRGGGHEICYKAYVERPIVDHDYKNMKLNRPMSPHLEVFAMTMPAGMSILQRVTGAILASYALLLTGGTLFLSNGIETYISIIQSLDLSAISVNIIKFGIGLPFGFHYFNGIRYVLWNSGRLLGLKAVNSTANMVLVAALAGAGAFAFFL